MVPWTLQVEKSIVVLAELEWLEDLGLFLQVLQCQAWLDGFILILHVSKCSQCLSRCCAISLKNIFRVDFLQAAYI